MEEKSLKGISLLSIFSLPKIKKDRIYIYKLALKYKKELHFVFEEKKFTNKNDIEVIEDYFIFNEPFFTQKKTNLTIQQIYPSTLSKSHACNLPKGYYL